MDLCQETIMGPDCRTKGSAYLVPDPLLLPPDRQGVLGIFALQVIHEGVPLPFHLRLLEPCEGFQTLGGNHSVPAFRGVHQPYVGESARAVAQGPVFPWIFCIVCRDHVGASPLGIYTDLGGRKKSREGVRAPFHQPYCAGRCGGKDLEVSNTQEIWVFLEGKEANHGLEGGTNQSVLNWMATLFVQDRNNPA